MGNNALCEEKEWKDIRPKLSRIELELLYEAMDKAGYDQEGGPKRKLLWRFYHLKSGSHTKGRTHSRKILQEYEDREARVKKTLAELEAKDPVFRQFRKGQEES